MYGRSDEAAESKLAPSFTPFHAVLLDIAFGYSNPKSDQILRSINYRCLSSMDLSSLATMVRIEFQASLLKALETPEEEEVVITNPHPFDVFLMERTFSPRNLKLAVLVPVKKVQEMLWMDAANNFWPLTPPSHIRKVASLSGPARVLESLLGGKPTELMQSAMMREDIWEVEDYDEDDTSFNPDLTVGMNESQKRAVATVSNGRFRKGFVVIQGPPGCGKTTTMVGMICAIGRGMIVAAPSNAAVANIALKLHATGRYDLMDICVYGENCDKSAYFLSPIHRSTHFQAFSKKMAVLKDDDDKEKQRLQRGFARWLHMDPDICTLEEMARQCPYINMDEEIGRDNLKSIVASASVVACSLNTSGATGLRRAIQDQEFHTFLLDEAGQCPEAEFYIATTFPGVERIIVVGDPKQLPATVIDTDNKKAGYGESWMGRVFSLYPNKVHLLNTQYRMDPAILEFPNACFYSRSIMSGDNVIGRSPYVEYPFRFVDTLNRGQEEREKHSFQNNYEVNVIKSMLRSDEDIVRIRRSDPKARVIIITPYRAQAELMRRMFESVKGLGSVDISTVDSFQGQEGEIVILSTVRTKSVGFVDDPQRLNVALTRAKRVIRVVGDLSFFQSQGGRSTLRQLAGYATQTGFYEHTKLNSATCQPPDWNQGTLWTPAMTQRFHHCLKPMSENDKNICLNTLLALCFPNLRALHVPPTPKKLPSWSVSTLRGCQARVQIVWVAKGGYYSPTVEAHFAGTYPQCLNFMQKQRELPSGAANFGTGMSRIVEIMEPALTPAASAQTIISWQLTNGIQRAIKNTAISELPQGSFRLDPHQEEIMACVPPLMIESRSGTGKTNVLFQHAVSHARANESGSINPICFVTVSPRLRKELKTRFEEVKRIDDLDLPQVVFFSFHQLIDGFLHVIGDSEHEMSNACTFLSFTRVRTSYISLPVESNLIENEIGGVITGSLLVAVQGRPLTRAEYLAEKRSNVTNKSEQGRNVRHSIYDQYELYLRWKLENGRFDVNDIILKLLNQKFEQMFDSVYLDEVQDFSYAALYFICSVAGKDSLNWTCAGDTAQMISPGCSFTFDGLKQTMLAVRPGIESRLSRVCHLLVNYRTTRDILLVGNAILGVAKKHYPDSIEYAMPEVAVKDLGLKVVLCDWDAAFSTKVAFGHNQALVYSATDNPDVFAERASSWLDGHPFLLSSLDSKGLEFDDVMVAFDIDRKAWNVALQSVSSLRMLRELYVAVTRARRRVVILVPSKVLTIVSFFKSLDCDLEFVEASTILLEFDSETSSETWFAKGMEFFHDEKYKLAAGCFNAAKSFGWALRAEGLDHKGRGQKREAVDSFRRAARFFCEAAEYALTLDLTVEIRAIPPWNSGDNVIYDRALENLPTYLSRVDIINFALTQNRWEALTVADLKCPNTSTLFLGYRHHDMLRKLVCSCTEEDREVISSMLPATIGDYYASHGRLTDAVKLYLLGKDQEQAEQTTLTILDAGDKLTLLEAVSSWENIPRQKRNIKKNGKMALLLQLFESPMSMASRASDCLKELGAEVIKASVRRAGLDDSNLHDFHKTCFQKDVLAALEATYHLNLISVVKWYLVRDDELNAKEFASKIMKQFSDSDLIAVIVTECGLRPTGLIKELQRRELLIAGLQAFLQPEKPDYENAVAVSDMALASVGKAESNFEGVLTAWRSITDDAMTVLNQWKGSLTWRLVLLFTDPEQSSATMPKACKTAFGNKIIEKAVFSGGPYSRDVKFILVGFGKWASNSFSSMGIIDMFLKHGNRQSASWYAGFNRSKWVQAELLDIIWEKQLGHPDWAVDELSRRNLFVEAMRLAVEGKDVPGAIAYADAALITAERAEENAIGVAEVWSDYPAFRDMQLLSFNVAPALLHMQLMGLHGMHTSASLKFLFLRQDPMSFILRSNLVSFLLSFGPSLVLYAVRRHELSDDRQVLADIIEFHRSRKALLETVRKAVDKKIDAMHAKVPAQAENHSANPGKIKSVVKDGDTQSKQKPLSAPISVPPHRKEAAKTQVQDQFDEGSEAKLKNAAIKKKKTKKKGNKKNKKRSQGVGELSSQDPRSQDHPTVPVQGVQQIGHFVPVGKRQTPTNYTSLESS